MAEESKKCRSTKNNVDHKLLRKKSRPTCKINSVKSLKFKFPGIQPSAK